MSSPDGTGPRVQCCRSTVTLFNSTPSAGSSEGISKSNHHFPDGILPPSVRICQRHSGWCPEGKSWHSLRCRRCSLRHGSSELCSRRCGRLRPPLSSVRPLALQTMTILRIIEKKKEDGMGGYRAQHMIISKKLIGLAIFLPHFRMTGKRPGWRMRWPSGPNANKTRHHLGLFLHIKP